MILPAAWRRRVVRERSGEERLGTALNHGSIQFSLARQVARAKAFALFQAFVVLCYNSRRQLRLHFRLTCFDLLASSLGSIASR